jgi:hypothetical protein
MTDWDRHGNERLYVRRCGRKVRIRAKPGTQEFAQSYAEALHALSQRQVADRPALASSAVGCRLRRNIWPDAERRECPNAASRRPGRIEE